MTFLYFLFKKEYFNCNFSIHLHEKKIKKSNKVAKRLSNELKLFTAPLPLAQKNWKTGLVLPKKIFFSSKSEAPTEGGKREFWHCRWGINTPM